MILDFTITKQILFPLCWMEEMKSFLQIWPNDKHIICTTNNDIPVKIPSHPYVLENRSVLCNCSIEANNHCLLESLAACDNINSKLTMYLQLTQPLQII